jgi:hypothetical protein
VTDVPEVVVLLEFDQEKVHSRRFKEIPVGGDPRLGTVYIPRKTLEAIGNPAALEVTIRPRQD